MPNKLKSAIRSILKDSFVWRIRERARAQREQRQWERSGRPVPPPENVKRKILSTYALAFGPKIMVETGTFLGDTTYALRSHFEKIFSIELNNDLFERAKRRFRSLPHIQIIQGDSAELLPEIMRDIQAPCLFWLDGHYSGGITARGTKDTPVMKELETVLGHEVRDHIILIDDARLFNGTDDYPTIEELRELFKARRPDYDFAVINDVIRIHQRISVQSEF